MRNLALTLEIGTSPMLMVRPEVLLARDKNDHFISRNFPQAPMGMDTFIQKPGLGKRTSGEQTLYYSFLVLLHESVPLKILLNGRTGCLTLFSLYLIIQISLYLLT